MAQPDLTTGYRKYSGPTRLKNAALMPAFYASRQNVIDQGNVDRQNDLSERQFEYDVANTQADLDLQRKRDKQATILGIGGLGLQAKQAYDLGELNSRLYGDAGKAASSSAISSNAGVQGGAGAAADAVPSATGTLDYLGDTVKSSFSTPARSLATLGLGYAGYKLGEPIGKLLTGKEGGWVTQDVIKPAAAVAVPLAANAAYNYATSSGGSNLIGNAVKGVTNFFSGLWNW